MVEIATEASGDRRATVGEGADEDELVGIRHVAIVLIASVRGHRALIQRDCAEAVGRQVAAADHRVGGRADTGIGNLHVEHVVLGRLRQPLEVLVSRVPLMSLDVRPVRRHGHHVLYGLVSDNHGGVFHGAVAFVLEPSVMRLAGGQVAERVRHGRHGLDEDVVQVGVGLIESGELDLPVATGGRELALDALLELAVEPAVTRSLRVAEPSGTLARLVSTLETGEAFTEGLARVHGLRLDRRVRSVDVVDRCGTASDPSKGHHEGGEGLEQVALFHHLHDDISSLPSGEHPRRNGFG